jgi:predicted acyl esterase
MSPRSNERPSAVALLVVGALVLALTLAGTGRPVPARAAEPVTTKDVPIKMSDGVRLYGDVHRPDAKGRFPVLLNMTPYGPATYFTMYLAKGYAHVNVDIRGTGRSGGALCIFCEREQDDVYEVVQWVARQPWSNGRVGMFGGSYQAITPLLGAAKQPPALKAIVPQVAYADAYRDIVWHNGMWNANFVTQWFGAQTALSMSGASTTSDLPARTGQRLANETRLLPWDDPFYRERSVYTKYDRITIPVLNIGGWFDGFSRGTIHNFQGEASKHKRLIMTPCTHKGCGAPFDPLSPYAEEAAPPGIKDPILAWMDRFLKGVDNGIEDGAPVLYYDLGSGTWESASSWPPASARHRSLYLSGAPSGSGVSLEEGSLRRRSPRHLPAAREARYVYDPSRGTGEAAAKWGTVAASPHARIDMRGDEAAAVTYTTPKQRKPLRLAGPMELRFWGSTTGRDTDWVAKVTDIAPDGSSTLLTSGFVRASHRRWSAAKSRPGAPWLPNTRPAPVASGKPYEYRVDIWDIAHTVKRGHRLRLTISSSDSANHEPIMEPALNAVFNDAKHPSRLILTVR